MRILHANDLNGRYAAPLQTAFSQREWIVLGDEHQTIGVIQIHRKLSFPMKSECPSPYYGSLSMPQ